MICAEAERLNMVEALKNKREEILRIAAKHGAKNVRIFGSAVRGESRPQSDIDLLVEVGPVHSPWFPAGLVADLEDLLTARWMWLHRMPCTGTSASVFWRRLCRYER